MKKKLIKITESQLKRVINNLINEDVNRIEPRISSKPIVIGYFNFDEGSPLTKNGKITVNGRPYVQGYMPKHPDYTINAIAGHLKNSGTLRVIEKYLKDRSNPLPKFIELNVGTSHTGSGETNANVADARLKFLENLVSSALNALGVDASIVKEIVVNNRDSDYSPTSLNKNFYNPNNLPPKPGERFGYIVVYSLTERGLSAGQVGSVQRRLNAASGGFLQNTDEDAIMKTIMDLQNWSDVEDLNNNIRNGGKWYDLEDFLNDQIESTDSERRFIMNHLNTIASQSRKGSNQVRYINGKWSLGL
jgi:hypothetical protein